MRRIALLLVFSLISTASLLAQNSAVSKATRYLDEGKLDLAKQSIDEAVVHEKTMDKGKTWYTKGKVYKAIALSENPDYQSLDDNALVESVESFKKAMEMEKENSTYHLFSQEEVNQLWATTLNKGAELFEAGEYEQAIEQFNDLQVINPEDTTGYLYAGIAAMQASQYEVAEKNYYKLLDMGYKSPDVYTGLIWLEKSQNEDLDKALELVEQARKDMPENLDIMREEINLLLSLERKEEALAKSEAAIQAEPENPSLYYITAYLYDEVGQGEKAEEFYKKAIEINPEYFDANYNLAVLYFNRGVEVVKEANNMTIEMYQKKGKEVKAKSKVHFEAAIPYLLKAHEIKPEDTQVVEILQTTYMELGMTDKAEEYRKKLDSMGGLN